MPEIVSATAVEMNVMPMRPMKLQMTLIMMAESMSMERVPTTSAMAFAASVAPFTKMVPRTRRITSARNGFDASSSKNCARVTKSPLFPAGPNLIQL